MANWSLDKAHSEIEFKVKHMMITNVKGQFQDFDITVDSDSNHLENAKIDLTIKTASINTKNEQRDEHLRGSDFLMHQLIQRLPFMLQAAQKMVTISN